MKQVNVKKLLILNLPYLLFVWLFDKAAQTVRLSPGADLSGKLILNTLLIGVFHFLTSLRSRKGG